MKEKKKKQKYWYKFYIEECVLCGCHEEWKEKMYTPKPKDIIDRYEHIETACGYHFM